MGLVSVLIPVYNVEGFIAQALRSVILQTYSDLDIVVVDDFSTDNTYQIALDFAAIDSRIRVFRNIENLKIARTLNFAFGVARGQFIARMDGDDVSAPDRIQRKIDYLLTHPAIDIVGCSVVAISRDGRETGRTTHYASRDFLVRTAKHVSPCSHIWVARRQVYEILEGYRDIPGAEDYDFLLRALSVGFGVTNLQDYFGYFVRLGRAGNTIDSMGARKCRLKKYVYALYLERQKYGADSHSEGRMISAIKVSMWEDILFRISSRFLTAAIQAKGFWLLPFKILMILCSLISPLQQRYLLSRFSYKIMALGQRK